jgi:hypothetical protein
VALLSEYLSRLQYHEKTWLEGLKRAGEGRHQHCFDMLLQHAEQVSRRGLIVGVIKSEGMRKVMIEKVDGEPFNSIVLSCLKHLGPGEPDLEQHHWRCMVTLASYTSSRFHVIKQLLEQGVNTHSTIRQALLDVLSEHDDARSRSKLLLREDRMENRIVRTRYLLSMGVGCGPVEVPLDCGWDATALRLLFDSGTELDARWLLGRLAEDGKLEELQLVLERGWGYRDDTLLGALFAAAEAGMEDAVALLLQHGVKGKLLSRQYSSYMADDSGGGEALFKACSSGHRGVVRRLLEWGGVDVNYKCPETYATVLAKCMEKRDWQGAVLLLGAGACVNARKRCTHAMDTVEVDEAAPSSSAAEWNSIVEVSVVLQHT